MQLEVSVSLHEIGGASLSVEQTLSRGRHTRLVAALVTLACVDAVRFKPVKIPALILQALDPAT